jgi:electron transfer flavoprotein beta subunit
MKIAVCVNHVPDTAAKITILPDGKGIETTGVSFIINPYDEYAVEEALRMKEKSGGEVIVVSVGQEQNKETIRKVLAMGADEGILLKVNSGIDSFGVAKLLADEIKNINCRVVFFGKQSVDYDNSIVGQITAAILDYNCISNCVSLNIDEEKVNAETEIEGGREVVVSDLPIVITAQKGLNEPRYPTLKGIMAAKKKNITEKNVDIPEPKIETVRLKNPSEKKPGRVLGSDASVVPELIKLLKEEAKVI